MPLTLVVWCCEAKILINKPELTGLGFGGLSRSTFLWFLDFVPRHRSLFGVQDYPNVSASGKHLGDSALGAAKYGGGF
jgi:hypothetical protein